MIDFVISDAELASVDEPELLALVQSLRDELAFRQKVIDKITHEMAVLKRLKFSATSEHFSPEQRSLLEETIDTDLAAAQAELAKARAAARAAAPEDKETPNRKPLPPELPRTEHRHEPREHNLRLRLLDEAHRRRGLREDWLEAQRARVPDGSAIAKAIDYSRGRWPASTRYRPRRSAVR